MLKKISTRQLRVGMFIHEVCGSWMDHPFWRASFKLTEARQIAQLAEVREVVIDTSKGLDVEVPMDAQIEVLDDVELDVAAPVAPDTEPVPLTDLAPQPVTACSFEQELARAGR
ncbi:MAG TPA: DUF3391 domain-containing protein, partial [Aquabacterium sp.]|nr:DUF3391 domain-containing protein [Aquabacterium sp.]